MSRSLVAVLAGWLVALAAWLAALVLLAAPAGASVQVGASGWSWGNPQPQGNSLSAASFAGGRGYAVGEFGTILATGDGGSSWSGLRSGTFSPLSLVQAINADSLFAGGGCVARRSDDGGQTFKRVAFSPVETACRHGLAAAWFVDQNTGYLALDDGTVLRTDNNGDSFAQKVAVPKTQAAGGQGTVTDMRFLDANTGFATGTTGPTGPVRPRLRIPVTADRTDGPQRTDRSHGADGADGTNRALERPLHDLRHDRHGLPHRRRGQLLDGGFAARPPRPQAVVHRLHARRRRWRRDLHRQRQGRDLPYDERRRSDVDGKASVRGAGGPALGVVRHAAVVRHGDGQQSDRPDDGRRRHGARPRPFAGARLGGQHFSAEGRIVALGRSGSTVISDDGGTTFKPVGARLPGKFSSIVSGPSGVAFALGADGAVARTTDGGKTWTRGTVATSEDVRGVSFPTAADGFALDSAGGLFRTADAGASWSILDTGTTARPVAVLARSSTSVLLAGPRGLRRSTDAGGTFNAVRGAINKSNIKGIDPAGVAVYAYGDDDVWRSLDGGRTWKPVNKPGRATRLRNGRLVKLLTVDKVEFLSGEHRLAARRRSPHRTNQRGKSWEQLNGMGSANVYGMTFSSAKNGLPRDAELRWPWARRVPVAHR